MIVLPAITAILIPFASYHAGAQPGEFNQFNPGVVVEADWLAAGAYKNSNSKTTVFVQAALWTKRYDVGIDNVRLGISGGLGTGYRYPVIGGLQVQGNYWNITLVPKLGRYDSDGNKTYSAIGFSLRIPIK